ncbi:Uncharacterised protein [uncultured archaeon]|nr:Uncharacterised protein [uncultured archaeon]
MQYITNRFLDLRGIYIFKNLLSTGEIMGDTIEVSRDAFEPIAELVKLGLFKDEKEALKNLVLDQAAAKIRHFDSKISQMRSKYKMSFNDFKLRIEERQGDENFEEWDDFIIWDSYESAKSYWAKVETKLLGRPG